MMTEQQRKNFKKYSDEVEQRARLRDQANAINVDAIRKEEEKAHKLGYRVIRTKKVSKVPFSQVIIPNVEYLIKAEYLSSTEYSLLFQLSVMVELNSNILVERSQNTVSPINISRIAEIFKLSRSSVSTRINKLIDKGIIFEILNGSHKIQVRTTGEVRDERVLMMNPEIIFAGSKNCINATLCRAVLSLDVIEKKHKLPLKIWMNPDSQHGALVSRSTYLKKKKSMGKVN